MFGTLPLGHNLPMSQILDRSVVAAPSALAREIDGNFTIYDKRNDSVMVLNDTASAIWRLCDGRRGTEIADELARSFAAPPGEIERDVVSVLKQLTERGLLVAPDPS
jgi:hypothetical protein